MRKGNVMTKHLFLAGVVLMVLPWVSVADEAEADAHGLADVGDEEGLTVVDRAHPQVVPEVRVEIVGDAARGHAVQQHQR